MKKLLISLLVLFAAGPMLSQVRIDSSFAFGPDTAKKYSLYIPLNYNPSLPSPMIVGFHPYDTARWNAASWCDTLTFFSESNNVIMVCPDGDSLGIITDSLDYAFTTALIDSVKKWYNIDNRRVYALGFSMGGKAVYEYGLNNASTFGGFIPIGPAISGSSFVSGVIHNAARRPFYLVHGASDFPNFGFYPMLTALYANCAIVDSILMPGVGHTIDFPNRNQILTTAYRWVDSVNLSPIKGSFSLNEPINFSTIVSKGFRDYRHYFKWEKSPVSDSCGTLKYKVMLDLPSGGFNPPVLTLNSDNAGTDTVLTLSNHIIDSLLASFSIPLNGSLALDWTVRSDINGIHGDTAKSFRITITRKKVGFGLISPTNNDIVTLQNGNNKFFDWDDMQHYISVQYQLLFDDTSGDFSSPLASFLSTSNGTTSSLNIDHESLYYQLIFRNNLKVGDTAVMKWRVLAYDTVLSEFSKSERVISFVRGDVGFKLFTPADNSLITSKKNVNYSFTWDSVLLADVRFEWRFDTLGVDLHDTASMVFGADNDSLNARIFISFEILDSIMNFYSVNYLDTLHGQWTARAVFDGSEEFSLTTYKVSIVRAHPVGVEELNSKDQVLIFPNPASDLLRFKLDKNSSWKYLEIYDAKAALVYSRQLKSGEKEVKIDVSAYPNGSFLWKLSDGNNSRSGFVIVNRH